VSDFFGKTASQLAGDAVFKCSVATVKKRIYVNVKYELDWICK